MKKLAVVLFGSALMLTACGGGNDDTDTESKTENEPKEELAAEDIMKNTGCFTCHGENLEGGIGPELKTVGSRLSEDQIREVIKNGRNSMPPQNLEGEELDEVVDFLANNK